VGDVTAMIATVTFFAIVPAIRYTDHGIRHAARPDRGRYRVRLYQAPAVLAGTPRVAARNHARHQPDDPASSA
jgi:hypothetical protein